MRKSPSIFESIQDLKTEQHANLIFAEGADAGVSKSTKRLFYEEMNEQLQLLIHSFHTCRIEEFFKKARRLFNI